MKGLSHVVIGSVIGALLGAAAFFAIDGLMPAFGFSYITDVFKAKDVAKRLGNRICALHEAGYSESAAIKTATKQMMDELSKTKVRGIMAKNALRDTLQETTDSCGITLR